MVPKTRILVLGAGAWGTALALALCRNPDNEVFLWGRDSAAVAAMRVSGINQRYRRCRRRSTVSDFARGIGVFHFDDGCPRSYCVRVQGD